MEGGNKKKGVALIVHDSRQKELIPIKILAFLLQAGIGIWPFMTIHMKSLGITVQEIGLVFGIVPPLVAFSPFAIGVIADKLGNFKNLFGAVSVAACVMTLSFLAIPTGRFIDAYPVNISLAVGCGSSGLTLLDLDSIDCDFKPSANLSLTAEECGYLCLDSEQQGQHLQGTNASLPADWPVHHQPHHKFRNGLFFPENWNLQIDCSISKEDCQLRRGVNRLLATRGETFFNQVALDSTKLSNSLYLLESMSLSNGRLLQQPIQCDAEYDRPIRLIQPLTFKLNNSFKSDQGVLSLTPLLDSEPSSDMVINYKMCRPQCIVRAPRSNICANKEHVVVFDPQLTFWSYLIVRLIYGYVMAGITTLFEGACLAVVNQVKGDFGLQRIFGLIGLMIFAPVSGALVDYFSINKSIADYRPTFYLSGFVWALFAAVAFFVDLDFKLSNTNLRKDIKSLLKVVELDVFFIVIFMSGLFWGNIEAYLFLLLEEMGGTKSLMGLTVTVSCLSGIVPLLFSDKIFRTIGHPNVQVIGFAVYVIRLIGLFWGYIEAYLFWLLEEMGGTKSLMGLTVTIFCLAGIPPLLVSDKIPPSSLPATKNCTDQAVTHFH